MRFGIKRLKMGSQQLQHAHCLKKGTGRLQIPYKARSGTHAFRSVLSGASAGQRFHHHFKIPVGVSATQVAGNIRPMRSNVVFSRLVSRYLGLQTLLQSRRRSTSVAASDADQPFLQYKEFASTQLFRVWIQGTVHAVHFMHPKFTSPQMVNQKLSCWPQALSFLSCSQPWMQPSQETGRGSAS